MSSDKSGSPPCGIYVRIDDFSNMLDLIGYVRQMAFAINRASGYEKNMGVVELAYSQDVAERIADIIPIIRAQGLVAVVSGMSDNLDSVDADGFLLRMEDDVLKGRASLGEDVILGIHATTKEDAQRALLLNADYLVVPADPLLIRAVKGGTDMLCAARGAGLTNKNCGALVQAGANFVDVSDYILGYEKGVMQATVNILHAFDVAVQTPDSLH
tara:strand:- start:10905 stop:11546 length:642 start_codon:yes stop_codon:yes gene_type:complete